MSLLASCKPNFRPAGLRRPASTRRSSSAIRTQALFGWGKKKNEEYRFTDEARDEQWKMQQEILAARKAGKTMEGVSERRAAAKAAMEEKKAKKKRDQEALARGEKLTPDKRFTGNKEGEYDGKEDPSIFGNIIIPLAPFGLPEFDNGERFDLKAPYTDEGWVDEDADAMGKFMGLFGGGKKKREAEAKAAAAAAAEAEAEAEAAAKKKKKGWF